MRETVFRVFFGVFAGFALVFRVVFCVYWYWFATGLLLVGLNGFSGFYPWKVSSVGMVFVVLRVVLGGG
jgi:hypothetical protein